MVGAELAKRFRFPGARHNDAMAVLCAAIDLVQGFLAGEQGEPKPAKKPALTVVPIGGNECAWSGF
jgi:hypothetical protein